ncbi:MAG TPA: protease pro-enzyme activation domain-containing protein [Acidobacteriaceae bacterium]
MRPHSFGPFTSFGALLLAAAAAFIPVPCIAQSSAASELVASHPTPARRVAANADFSARVQLGGHLPGWAQAENAAGTTVSLSAPLKVTLVLKRDAATEAAFETLLAQQQTPGSALYHQWLTPAQVGSLYGLAPADLQAVEQWLESEGLTVTRVEPNGVLVDVTGSVAAVSTAFRTSFAEFNVGGDTRLSATTEPSVPQALEAVIAGVHGLSQTTLHPQSIAIPMQGQPQGQRAISSGAKPMLTTTGGQHFLTPNDFATIYDLGSVYSGGNKGATVGSKAQRIAIVGRSRVAATDISEFESLTGLPTAQPNVIIPTGGTDPGTTNGGDQDEATLDVDRVMGTAPGVGVDLVVSADSKTVSGIYTAAEYEVNTLLDPIMTISFGDCEANAGQQGVSVWDTLFSAAAAEGISVMVSSGDSGAAGCDGDSSKLPVTQTASINYICSSSYATCVGGTEFADTSAAGSYWSAANGSGESSATGYIPEGAWNEPTGTGANGQTTYAAAGTGGGASQFIAKPSWQTGTGVPQDGRRDVPDVSLSSATHDGYVACLAYAGGDCSKQEFEVFGGTSAAAPGMAGIVALMNQATGSAAGNLNPLLYRLAASSSSVFHDVTASTAAVAGCTLAVPSMCNNSTPSATGLTGGLEGFAVGTGFDEATGWGSVDGAKLVAAALSTGLSATSASTGSFTMGTSASSLNLTAGSTTGNTMTVFATAANGFAGVVSLTCTVTPQGTSALAPGCTATPATVTLSTASPSGSAVVTMSSQAAAASTSSCTSNGTPNVRLGGLALVGICVLLLPVARRRDLRGLLMVIAAAAGMSGLMGCGGGTSAAATASASCAAQGTSGTTSGGYTVTITGTSGSTTASTSFTVTVK